MRICAIENCHSRKDDENILYFSFPMQDDKLLQHWLTRINNADWKPDENSRICSAHFRFYDFDRTEKGLILKSNAVPTIFPNVIYVYSTNSGQAIPGFKNLVNEKKDTQGPKTMPVISSEKQVFSAPEPRVIDLEVEVPTKNGVSKVKPREESERGKKSPAPEECPALENPKTLDKETNLDESSKEVDTQSTNKVPVLRISINKKYSSTKCPNGSGRKRKYENGANEIETRSGGKSVIFRLDPNTKEIIVLKKNQEKCTDDGKLENLYE